MIITATQIKIVGLRGYFRFVCLLFKIRKQLSVKKGLREVRYQGLHTLSIWDSYEEMKAFRNQGSHLEAMKRVRSIGKTKSVTWESEQDPSWVEAKLKLKEVSFRE